MASVTNIAVQGHDGEGHMHIAYSDVPVTLAGDEVVQAAQTHLFDHQSRYGPLHPKMMISPRIAPPMIGLGLVEAIREADIRRQGRSRRREQGRHLGPHQRGVVADARQGRLDWPLPDGRSGGSRASTDQSAAAASRRRRPVVRSVPHGDRRLHAAAQTMPASMRRTEISEQAKAASSCRSELLDLVTFYSQNLAVPARRGAG